MSPTRIRFARACAGALGAWGAASTGCREVIGRVSPELAESLDAAERAVDDLLDEEGPASPIDLRGAVSAAATAARSTGTPYPGTGASPMPP